VGFGAIQIEDVAAPECFKITRELDRRLRIPVMHDDQHGTATIVTAGLLSALRKTGKKIGELTLRHQRGGGRRHGHHRAAPVGRHRRRGPVRPRRAFTAAARKT